MSDLDFCWIDSVHHIATADWDALNGDYPFLRWAFLAALEDQGCLTEQTGWLSQHLCVYRGEALHCIVPGFIKLHSYGEYVFDWAWADAYRRYGFEYYPKWINAAPLTPAIGPRFLTNDSLDDATLQFICGALKQRSEQQQWSGIHSLFNHETLHEQLIHQDLLARHGTQFHWFNHDYGNFDDFLATFSSRKRKNLRKERASLVQHGLMIERLEGAEVSTELWREFYRFYRSTYMKRSGHSGYLNEGFFLQIAATMADNLVLCTACDQQGEYLAAALCFKDHTTLYGRYWGCHHDIENLHFELCYYQGIEYAIEKGLARFDPGAQGEHKIQRGFQPITTYSNHWLREPGFQSAIADFLQAESQQVAEYRKAATELLPFKQGG